MMRCFLICLFGGALVAQEGLQSSQRLVVEGVFRSQAVVDIEGDGRPELLLGREDGILFVYRQADSQGFEETPWATLELGDPSSLIVTTVQKLGGPIGAAILALGPEGARAWPLTSDGKLGEMVLLSRRARFELRTRGPVFLDFARDIDSDGNLDLLVPALETIEVWLQRPPRDPGDSPEFRKSARISVKSSVDSGTANRIGDDALYQRIRIPDLQTKDVNGDGKPDLLVERGKTYRFHIQREDGGIPFEPDVILDLERFRDTTPKAPLRPGFTVPGTERTRAVIRDLDADGIPDYVITHRRKVWVFHGTNLRPQFTRPSHVLKTADEITTVQVVSLDDDDYPDLLLLRVQVPSIGSLITGLLGSFSVDLRASGYANEGGQRFAKDAAWKRELVFDMPSLGEVLRDPESILKRLEDAGSELRETLSGDLDGDGTNDQILVDEATGRFEVWKGVPGVEVKGPTTLDRVLRRVLFEDEKTRWDLDRVIAFIEDLGRSEMSRLTEGRQRVGFWDGRVEGLGDPVQRTVAVSDRGRSWLVLFYPRAGDEPAMVIQSVTVRP